MASGPKLLLAASLALGGFLASTPVAAQGYVGASLGQSDIDESVTVGLIDPGSGPVDGTDTGLKLFGGYRFHPNFALEIAYVDLGELAYRGTAFSGLAPVTNGTVEVSGFNVGAVGRLPLTERFSLFGKLGMFAWSAEARDLTSGVPFASDADGSDLSLGVGASYELTGNLAVRGEWERFEFDRDEATLLSIGLAYRF